MGNQISRIEREFILQAVADNRIEIRMSVDKQEFTGTIEQVDEEYVYLTYSEADSSHASIIPGATIIVYFSYYGHVMTFSSTIRSVDGSAIRTDMPESLLKNLSRKYTRVPAPDGATVSFSIQETSIELAFPKSEEYDPVEAPALADEFDLNHLEELVAALRERTKRKATSSRIVMFRGRQPDGFEEELISQTGKILYVPNTSGRFPENDFQLGGRIITRAMLLSQESPDGSLDRLPSLLASKREAGILAEIYCPILFHQYVVGYIYLSKERETEGVFDHDLLEFVHQFAQVLAYSLKVNGYFKESIPEAGNYHGEIVDISAAGILFCNDSERLSEILALYTDLDLQLKFGDRKLRIVGRVMRKIKNGEVNCYGLQFMEMKPEDFRFLFEYVYGRAVRSEDEQLWEGGADPPELEF